MKTILITGCAGFIGSHLCEELLVKKYRVIGVDNFDNFYNKEIKIKNMKGFILDSNFVFKELDLSCIEMLDELNNEAIDAVIHLAAKVGVLPSLKDPQAYIKANVLSTSNVLDFMVKNKIKKFLFASSSSVYGNNQKIPFTENDAVDQPISPYAVTKRTGELLNYNYHNIYDIDVINLRFFTVFGPRQRPDLAIHKFFSLIAQNKAIEKYGDGSSSRDYTYVKDINQGIGAALEYLFQNNKVFEIINLGNSSPVSLKSLITAIYEVEGKEENVVVKEMQAGDVQATYADISKAERLLAYRPKTTLKEGLIHFKNWYDKLH